MRLQEQVEKAILRLSQDDDALRSLPSDVREAIGMLSYACGYLLQRSAVQPSSADRIAQLCSELEAATRAYGEVIQRIVKEHRT